MSSYITKDTLEEDVFLDEGFFLPGLFPWLFLHGFQTGNGFPEETNHQNEKINYPDAQWHQVKNSTIALVVPEYVQENQIQIWYCYLNYTI